MRKYFSKTLSATFQKRARSWKKKNALPSAAPDQAHSWERTVDCIRRQQPGIWPRFAVKPRQKDKYGIDHQPYCLLTPHWVEWIHDTRAVRGGSLSTEKCKQLVLVQRYRMVVPIVQGGRVRLFFFSRLIRHVRTTTKRQKKNKGKNSIEVKTVGKSETSLLTWDSVAKRRTKRPENDVRVDGIMHKYLLCSSLRQLDNYPAQKSLRANYWFNHEKIDANFFLSLLLILHWETASEKMNEIQINKWGRKYRYEKYWNLWSKPPDEWCFFSAAERLSPAMLPRRSLDERKRSTSALSNWRDRLRRSRRISITCLWFYVQSIPTLSHFSTQI